MDGCHFRELEHERLVYDPATHEVAVLNRTAAWIFDLCDGERTVAGILEALQERYDAPEEALRRDLESTLADLRSKRLLA